MPVNVNLSHGHQFKNISEIAKLIYSSADLKEILKRLTQGVCEHSNWAMSSIQVLDIERNLALSIQRFDPYSDVNTPYPKGWNIKISPVGQVLKNRKSLVLQDAAEQDEFPAFRDDARQRGYHTVVITPLDILDEQGRPMVFSVFSRKVVTIDDSELQFLQCVADLTGIAIHKMRHLKHEVAEAQELQSIVQNLTSALSNTLDTDAAPSLSEGLTRLFSAGWYAIDLTTGRGIFDPQSPPPISGLSNRAPEELIVGALKATYDELEKPVSVSVDGQQVSVSVDGQQVSAVIKPLKIDGSQVGALFLFGAETLNENQKIAAEAGRLALSTFILRNFIVFKTRRITARRLLSRLFAQDWHDVDDIVNEAHTLDFDLTQTTRLLVIRNSKSACSDDGAHSFILRSSQGSFGATISCILNGDVVLLLHDNDAIHSDRVRQNFSRRIQTVLPVDTFLALSEPIRDITEMTKSYESCLRTLSFAQAVSTTGWLSEGMLGAFPTLMVTVDTSSVQRFLNDTIASVGSDGSPKGIIALATIEAFLNSGRRFQETADTLGVHVSTLRYRLEQMSEKHGFDFTDHDSCFELELGLRLHRLVNSYDT